MLYAIDLSLLTDTYLCNILSTQVFSYIVNFAICSSYIKPINGMPKLLYANDINLLTDTYLFTYFILYVLVL